MISPVPNLVSHDRSQINPESYLVLACDGIFEVHSPELISEASGDTACLLIVVAIVQVMNCEGCCEFVDERLQAELPLGEVCEQVIQHCYDQKSGDNMSMMLVQFLVSF